MANVSHVSGMRHPYHGIESIFDIKDLASLDPMKQFEEWFEYTRKKSVVQEPNAMSLATATRDGVPSVRMMLCKGFNKDGFTFFTNYNSRKGRELEENPKCSLMFYWEPLKRSVRIEGEVEKVSEEESTEYFDSRPRESRLGALVSQQSTVIPNRQSLCDKNKELQEKYKTEHIPKPSYWGGYLVRPHVYEFWQGQTNRLHDRIRFRKLQDGETLNKELMFQGEGDWIIERLSA